MKEKLDAVMRVIDECHDNAPIGLRAQYFDKIRDILTCEFIPDSKVYVEAYDARVGGHAHTKKGVGRIWYYDRVDELYLVAFDAGYLQYVDERYIGKIEEE